MAMSAKDFNAMGIEFGLMLKEIDFDSDPYSKEKRLQTVRNAITGFMRVATVSNSSFDKDRFAFYVTEVRVGERDARGKKVSK